MKIGSSQSWAELLESLGSVMHTVPEDSLWKNSALLADAHARIRENLDSDLKALSKDGAFLFSKELDNRQRTKLAVDFIRQCHITGNAPSMSAICVFAIEGFALDLDKDLLFALLMASVLGEVDHEPHYHNNMHFRKVLLHTIRLIGAHNEIFEGTNRELKPKEMALLLIAACIHDLGHDGLGNTIKGAFYQGRLERRSFALASPYMAAVGYMDTEAMSDLLTILLCTEVTPLGDPGNSVNQMKAAYRYHFMGEKLRAYGLNLDQNLARLETNSRLATMALLMHEADIATSAGLDYALSKYETIILMQEFGVSAPTPQHIIDFLNDVCHRQFLSDAGQRLYAANMARIYALAEEDVAAGNVAFPVPEKSEFITQGSRADQEQDEDGDQTTQKLH